jgi:hypothetical protein
LTHPDSRRADDLRAAKLTLVAVGLAAVTTAVVVVFL